MRNATILVVRLKGVATEAIKNIVLAGIGRLVVVDPDDVAPEDLGAGFFFRDADVGSKVSGDAARPWVLAPRTHARTHAAGANARFDAVRRTRAMAGPPCARCGRERPFSQPRVHIWRVVRGCGVRCRRRDIAALHETRDAPYPERMLLRQAGRPPRPPTWAARMTSQTAHGSHIARVRGLLAAERGHERASVRNSRARLWALHRRVEHARGWGPFGSRQVHRVHYPLLFPGSPLSACLQSY